MGCIFTIIPIPSAERRIVAPRTGGRLPTVCIRSCRAESSITAGFPRRIVPGFHVIRPDSHWFLEQHIPFDFSNQAVATDRGRCRAVWIVRRTVRRLAPGAGHLGAVSSFARRLSGSWQLPAMDCALPECGNALPPASGVGCPPGFRGSGRGQAGGSGDHQP